MPLQPPWYVDLDEGVLGTLKVPGNPDVIARLYLPPLSVKEAALVAEALHRTGAGVAHSRRERQ